MLKKKDGWSSRKVCVVGLSMNGVMLDRESLHDQCRMSGVPSGRECSGTSRGSSAHAGTSEMWTSGVRPFRENGNYLKWLAN